MDIDGFRCVFLGWAKAGIIKKQRSVILVRRLFFFSLRGGEGAGGGCSGDFECVSITDTDGVILAFFAVVEHIGDVLHFEAHLRQQQGERDVSLPHKRRTTHVKMQSKAFMSVVPQSATPRDEVVLREEGEETQSSAANRGGVASDSTRASLPLL